MKDARAADARRAAGEAGALLGIPVAQKDIFCTRGLATTCGSKMLANFVAPYDAHVVEKFGDAGAVLLGKTNMDEFAMGSSNETSHFGPVKNPWRTSAVPGGSSGGSAAAVAARMAPAATGTDTGGSIRQPAAFSGICGLKPTYGVVSRYGMIAFASSLDQGGPMAKTAADLAVLLNVMAGFDARDSTSLERPGGGLCARPRPSACRIAHRAAGGIFQRGRGGGCGEARARSNPLVRGPGREDGRDHAAEHATRRAGVLRARARGGLVEPVALRRRALRPPRRRIRGPLRDVLQDARRGLRRRSEAPDPGRDLRALARLLRRLLPAGAEDPPPDREGFRRGVRADAT